MPSPYRIKSTEDAPVRWEYDKIAPYAARSRPYPRPDPGIFDAPYVCLKINILWLPHIMGALDVLNAWDAWDGDNDGQSARDEIEKLLAAMADDNGCLELEDGMLLRQKPGDVCEVQQSSDGGTTWTTAFRFDNCVTTEQQVTYNNYIQNTFNDYVEQITNLVNQYDGDVTNIYPDAGYGDADDDNRDLALCYAISRAVDVVSEGTLIAIQEQAAGRSATLLLVAAVVGVFVIGTILTGGTLAAAGAALGGTTGLALSGIGATTAIASWVNNAIARGNEAAYQDLDAREQVKCVMYNALKGATITEAAFADALNDHGLTGNAGVIATTMDEANEVTENFVGFLNLLQQSFAAAKTGIITEANCPCGEPWTHQFPDTNGWNDFDMLLFSNAQTVVVADKIVGANGSPGTVIFLSFEVEVTASVTSIETDFEWLSNGNPSNKELQVYVDDVLINTEHIGNSGTFTLVMNAPQTGTRIYRWLAGIFGTTGGGQYLRVTEQRWTGTGDDPFA